MIESSRNVRLSTWKTKLQYVWRVLRRGAFEMFLPESIKKRFRKIRVVLSLGSNMGDREQILKSAFQDLQSLGIKEKISSIWESDPWGDIATHNFLNAVVIFYTRLSPQELLAKTQEIEDLHGRNRQREEKWGDRTLDIDILFYGDMILYTEDLEIPHKYADKRAFVLLPLLEVDPDFEYFHLQKSAYKIYEALSESSKKSIQKYISKE